MQKISQESYPHKGAVHTPGGVEAQSTKVAQTNREIHERRHSCLMEQVVQRENMKSALDRVEYNKGAPGVDGITIKTFREHLKADWVSTREKLLNGTYKPQPVRRVEIPKPDGGVRLLGIPTVMDRLIQQAILQILTPLIDPTFSESSYGFRPKRGAHQAVEKARGYIAEGYTHVVDMDLEKFFDKVNHDILMSKLAKRIDDKRVLKTIRNYLQAGVMIEGIRVVTEEGTPQGGPISPLLANVMLHDLDVELTKRGHKFVRYADDCNIYVKSKRAGERVMQNVKRFLEQQLRLKVNDAKSAVDKPWKRKFLGFTYAKVKEVVIRIAPKSIKRVEERIRQLTKKGTSQPMEARIENLNSYLRGWIGYFYKAQMRDRLDKLDKWIRRRLRACYLEQWKNPRTKRRNLVALGIPKEEASCISSSGKGCWRLSRTHQLNKALGLAYWREQKLISLVGRYDALRASA